jgi:UDP-3-O-[3-hydroxymyristoyl] glucosamine N-acyltransferase
LGLPARRAFAKFRKLRATGLSARHGRRDFTVNVTVRQLAEWVRGEVLGDPDLAITNARTLTEAGPGDITFVETDKNLSAWNTSKASAAVVGASVPVSERPVIRVADPLMAFADIVRQLRGHPAEPRGTIDPTSHVHPTVQLAPGVTVGPFVVIGEGTQLGENTTVHAGTVIGRFCKLGRDNVLHPRVVLYDDCVLGDRVHVHAGAVLGADGFGYRTQQGRHVKVPQLGWVEVGDDVEIGAGSTIDRGTFGPTRIGAGTKIGDLVQIGHNCQIGRDNLLGGQVGIAGSCVTGDHVAMAEQVGVADHLRVGGESAIAAGSGVTGDVAAGARVRGYPARPECDVEQMAADAAALPTVLEDLRRIREHLGLGERARRLPARPTRKLLPGLPTTVP